jgi:exodeoxyribonuclease VII large subunit
LLADAQTRDAQARGRLTAAARHQLRVHRERLGTKASTLTRTALVGLESRQAALRGQAGRLGSRSMGQVDRVTEQHAGWRRLLAAYDVDRQLERGYTLTLRADGSLVRSAADVAPGQALVTRLADGSVRSRVEELEATEQTGRAGGPT